MRPTIPAVTMRWLLTLAVVVLLTLLTQIGGAVWIVTLGLLRRRRAGVAVFLALFLAFLFRAR